VVVIVLVERVPAMFEVVMVLMVVVVTIAAEAAGAVVKVVMSLAVALVDAQVMAVMQERFVKRMGRGSFLQPTLLVAVPLEEAMQDQAGVGLEELCQSLTFPLEVLSRK